MSEFSAAQMEQLDAFLLTNLDQGGMPLDAVHGFLTAILSGPHSIMPNVWLPRILGNGGIVQGTNLEAGIGSLMALYENIIDELEAGVYQPMIPSLAEGHEDPLPLPYGWCEGYIMGWNVQGKDSLDIMAEDELAAQYLGPVAVFLMYEEAQLLAPPDEEEHRLAADRLADSAMNLFRWWLPRRDHPQPAGFS